jgi:hypothetical protein
LLRYAPRFHGKKSKKYSPKKVQKKFPQKNSKKNLHKKFPKKISKKKFPKKKVQKKFQIKKKFMPKLLRAKTSNIALNIIALVLPKRARDS